MGYNEEANGKNGNMLIKMGYGGQSSEKMFVYYCCLDENGLCGRTGLGTTLIFNIHMRHDAAHIIYFDMQ